MMKLLWTTMALVLFGCATPSEKILGNEEDNPIISASYAAADRLITDKLRQDLLNNNKVLMVASLVDVNEVSSSSIFGKMMAEQLASRLVQIGIPVVEVKLRTNLFISEQGGEMLLSREIKDIGRQHNADAVVVGTYANAGNSGIYVTVKVVRAIDGIVMSATNFMVDRKLVSTIIQ